MAVLVLWTHAALSYNLNTLALLEPLAVPFASGSPHTLEHEISTIKNKPAPTLVHEAFVRADGAYFHVAGEPGPDGPLPFVALPCLFFQRVLFPSPERALFERTLQAPFYPAAFTAYCNTLDCRLKW